MKIKNRQSKKVAVEEFINSADSTHATDNIDKNVEEKKKYKRVTFSLDEETKKMIEALSIKSTSNKTSNSDIVKIAIRFLNTMNQEEFEQAVSNFK